VSYISSADAPHLSRCIVYLTVPLRLCCQATEAELQAAEEEAQQVERRIREQNVAANRAVVEEIFDSFDADGDGKLTKGEYRDYLVGIDAWGKGTYTDAKWDTPDGWPDECALMESGVDGISREAFHSLLYGRFRVTNIESDIQKVRGRNS
jgi:hypothetical protein